MLKIICINITTNTNIRLHIDKGGKLVCKPNLDFQGIISIKKNGEYIYRYCSPNGGKNTSKKSRGKKYIIYTEAK